MRSRDSTLHQRPETLDCLRVNIPAHVDTGIVVDLPAVEHLVLHGAVARKRVCVNDRTLLDVLADSPDKIDRRDIGNRIGADASLAFHHPEHGLFLIAGAPTTMRPACWRSASGRPTAFPAHVRLVSLNRSVQDDLVLRHELLGYTAARMNAS